jgi:hypothetical protein
MMPRQDIIRKLINNRKIAPNRPRPRNRKLRGHCWLWTGNLQSGDQYGKVWIGDRYYYVHRVSAYLWKRMALMRLAWFGIGALVIKTVLIRRICGLERSRTITGISLRTATIATGSLRIAT